MTSFVFYGRVATENQQTSETSRAWQSTRAKSLVDAHGTVVAEYFDVGQPRSFPWERRPRTGLLLEALKDPHRGFDAVVVGEPHHAFYGNQFRLTFPLFEYHEVELWLPEVGGPVDPTNDAHVLVMSVLGGASADERGQVTIRERQRRERGRNPTGRQRAGRQPSAAQTAAQETSRILPAARRSDRSRAESTT